MSDLLRAGSIWLEQMLMAHCSSPVEYRRGSEKLSLRATFGRTRFEIADESGLSVGSHVWDFLIAAAELGMEPRPGDVIAADGQLHEVMNLAGDGCWRWSDPFRTTYRIHTRQIGAEA